LVAPPLRRRKARRARGHRPANLNLKTPPARSSAASPGPTSVDVCPQRENRGLSGTFFREKEPRRPSPGRVSRSPWPVLACLGGVNLGAGVSGGVNLGAGVLSLIDNGQCTTASLASASNITREAHD
jgi:hypothetical protein